MIEQPTIPDGDLMDACRKHASAGWALLNMQVSTIETYNLMGTKVPAEDAAVAYGLLLQVTAFNRLVELLESGVGVATDPGESSYTTRLVARAVTGTFTERSGTERSDESSNEDEKADPDAGFGEEF